MCYPSFEYLACGSNVDVIVCIKYVACIFQRVWFMVPLQVDVSFSISEN